MKEILILIAGMALSVFGTILVQWFIEGRKKSKEDVDIAVQVGKTHELVKDTREDVLEIKEGFNKLEEKVDAQGKRLTIVETEHKMYCRVLHGKVAPEETKDMTLVRVLVVDDQEMPRQYMYDYFHETLPKKKEWKKYIFQVDTASCYDEAVRKLDAHPDYKLGIFDYKLDKEDIRNGFHIAAYCKQKKYLCNGKQKSNFIVYTADDQLKNVPKEFAEHFLVKPATQKEWAAFENRMREMI